MLDISALSRRFQRFKHENKGNVIDFVIKRMKEIRRTEARRSFAQIEEVSRDDAFF